MASFTVRIPICSARCPTATIHPRSIGLDRIVDPRISWVIGEVPESFDIDAWLAEGFGIWRGEQYHIVLRFLPAAADRARNWRFHPYQTLTDEEDGSVTIAFRASGLRELADHLFAWAGEFQIVSPDSLAREIDRRMKAMRGAVGAHALRMS